jgi:2,4-dienoyl-CoA reductase-like NADH-dependent reductase (Old Yellow Enzyme family)/thioredoxin reductase
MVHIGSSPIDFGRARDFFGCLSVTRDTDVAGIRRLAEEVHRYDAKFSIELIHAGRIARPGALEGRKAYVPWVTPDMDPEKFMQVGEEEMEEVITLFENAAMRLIEAGVDQALIHGAHGNFMSAWLSPLTNQRDDEYGGSIENRGKFPLRVLERVRKKVGDRLNLDYRISQNEYAPGGVELEDIIKFLQMASEYIDSAFLSGGWMFHDAYKRYMMPGYPEERCLNIARTAVVKKNLAIPVVCVGNIPSVEAAEAILAEGKADVVAMARNILADMDYVKKAYRGRQDTIRPCLRCIECASRPGKGSGVRCAVNPRVGREHRYPSILKAEEKKKVIVIGGGPAGMTAAKTAARRGHDVTLYEKTQELGGRLKEASVMYMKADHHQKYLPWVVKETLDSDVKVVFGVEVTPEFAEKENADVIIVACGGEHIKPPIPGVDNPKVVSVTDADLDTIPIGDTVVVIGGGLAGLECAIELGHKGKKVTVIDQLQKDKLWLEIMPELRYGLIELKDKNGVELIAEARVTSITEECVEYEKPSGEKGRIAADTYVLSCGIAPDKELVAAFKEIQPDVYVIGDARAAGKIYSANHEGFNLAIEL